MPIGDDFMEEARSLAPFHDRFLLTGAGFARPWEGYLASEFWDQIIRDPVIRELPKVDDLLHRTTAFEDALAEVEVARRGDFSDGDRVGLREAVRRAFEIHDQALCANGTDAPGLLNRFVERFVDNSNKRTVPLFTLNQDLMLERYYTKGDAPRVVVPCVHRQAWWFGGRSVSAPCLDRIPNLRTNVNFSADQYVQQVFQKLSYIKLHGSLDWRRDNDEVLVLGGSKEESIAQFQILSMSFAVFRAALASGRAHLLVIGYGFADKHVNDLIGEAIESHGLRISVIDPTPSGVLRKHLEGNGWPQIWRGIAGYYTRPLKEVLREGTGEWKTLMRSFFAR